MLTFLLKVAYFARSFRKTHMITFMTLFINGILNVSFRLIPCQEFLNSMYESNHKLHMRRCFRFYS